MKKNVLDFVVKYRYGILLFGLIQHLFAGILIHDDQVYLDSVWTINMIILGLSFIGVFMNRSKIENIILNIFILLVIALPLARELWGPDRFVHFIKTLSVVYGLFFCYALYELLVFLFRPNKITSEILSAAACGFLLLIEIFTFSEQYMYYDSPASLRGIDTTSIATVFMDLVYSSTISLTTIGFGDITPNSSYNKLFFSLMGLVGQFYNILLVGILVSRFSSTLSQRKKDTDG